MNKTSLIPKSKAKNAYELLSEVRALILAEPKRYDQGQFISRPRAAHGAACVARRGFPSCGTVGCIAGWIATLKGPKNFSYEEARPIATKILGDLETWDLFDGAACSGYAQTAVHARAGAKHIRAFQKKYAAQLKATRV